MERRLNQLQHSQVNLIKEVDGLTTSKQRMCSLEARYGISSKIIWENNYDPSMIIIDEDDLDFWKFYIECFLDCGGTFNALNGENV